MIINNVIKTKSKIFTYDEDPRVGIITNGRWYGVWGFDYGTETIAGGHDLTNLLNMDKKYHQLSEAKPEKYYDFIKFIFDPVIHIEK